MKWKTYEINFEMIDDNGLNKTNVYLIYSISKLQAINELLDLLNESDYQLRKINDISILKRP